MQLSAGVAHPLLFLTTLRGCMNAAAVRMEIPSQHACWPRSPSPSPSPLSHSHHAGSKCRFWQENVPHDGKKVFHASPTHFSLLAISVIISKKQNVLQVASWLLSACCLLHGARCPLPVARCLLPGGTVDPGLANYAPRAKWWNRWRCTNANALG